MGISLRLAREAGDTIEWAAVDYLPPVGVRDEAAFPMLSGVDEVGNSIFNSVQRVRLLKEAESLLAGDLSLRERSGLEAVVDLCVKSRHKVHRYLWFVGD